MSSRYVYVGYACIFAAVRSESERGKEIGNLFSGLLLVIAIFSIDAKRGPEQK